MPINWILRHKPQQRKPGVGSGRRTKKANPRVGKGEFSRRGCYQSNQDGSMTFLRSEGQDSGVPEAESGYLCLHL